MMAEKLFVEKMPTIPVGAIFLVLGLLFVILNFTVLPIFGILLGIVFFLIGGFILKKYHETAGGGTQQQSG
ncbi:MAG: hypothetical protein ACLFPR_10690 [Desulfococcaceae bacterium]